MKKKMGYSKAMPKCCYMIKTLRCERTQQASDKKVVTSSLSHAPVVPNTNGVKEAHERGHHTPHINHQVNPAADRSMSKCFMIETVLTVFVKQSQSGPTEERCCHQDNSFKSDNITCKPCLRDIRHHCAEMPNQRLQHTWPLLGGCSFS